MSPRGKVSVAQLIQRESADAEVVFLGLATPASADVESYAERMEDLAGDLPVAGDVTEVERLTGDRTGHLHLGGNRVLVDLQR